MRSFETWDTEAVETELGIVEIEQSDLLDNWLSSTTTFSESDDAVIKYVKSKISQNVDYWNTEETNLFLISPLTILAYFDLPKVKIFNKRKLKTTKNAIEIGGKVDFMLSKGKQRPSDTYFIINNYKQRQKKTNDPKGQLLIQLLAAQYRNENEHPIYGCYVIGRNWFFVVLHNNQYAVSKPYIASDEDIYKIVAFLREIKVYIEKLPLQN